jgi:hypothetical protein
MYDAVRQGLHDLGYIEGRNIILEFRLAHGDYSQFPRLAAELADLPVEVIVAGTRAVDIASGRVPVVVPTLFDPVGQGLASSFSRPGGNVTGFTLMSAELDAKRQPLDLGIDRRGVPVLDIGGCLGRIEHFADLAKALHHSLGELGILDEFLTIRPFRDTAEAAHPLSDVGLEPNPSLFAIIDDIDAGFRLLLQNVRDPQADV